MKQLRKWLWALLALVLILPFVSGKVAAEEILPAETEEAKAVTYKDSGRSSVGKLTMDELRAKLDAIPAVSSLYATEPIVSATGYRPAVLSTAGFNNVRSWINYYRSAAGLSTVTFSDEANLSASWGSLVLAMLNNGLNHTPPQPEGMSQEDYQKGYSATSTSNLSWCAGYPDNMVLQTAVQGQIEDEDPGNIQVVGHRRWLLHPDTKTMGASTAHNQYTYYGYTYNAYYTDIKVFGSGVTTSQVTDYDFIAWPASGNNLSDTFPNSTPWSITLNLKKYAFPEKTQVQVRLTRKSDGQSWTFDQNDYTTDSNAIGADYEYFNVDTHGYAVQNCIIFRPPYSGFEQYDGEYIVDVTGLQDASGNPAELHYKVLFEPYDTPHVHEYELKSWTWASDYSTASATFVCKGDSSHTLKLDATITKKTTAATCETAGKTVYTAKVTLDGTGYTNTKTVTIPALGHKYTNATVEWTSDYSSATGSAVCERDASHTLKETVKTTSAVTTQPTCTAKGKTTYTAKFSHSVFGTKKRIVSNIPATGHAWNTGSIIWDGYVSAKASRTCKNDTSHKETVNCTVRSEVTMEPTETEDGLRTFFAKATFSDGTVIEDTKTKVLPKGKWLWTRLAGANRYDTMAMAAQAAYADHSCTTLIIASGQAFPDALSGSALAGALGCPILLTNTKKLADETKAEIQRLAAPNCQVLILGGTGAVSEAAERAIKNLGIEGLTTKRVAGANRDETMRAVYAEGNFPAGGMIIVATGYSYADVLSISPYAYAAKAPIILTKKNGSLTPEAKALLENEAKPSKVIIIGGAGVVTEATENYLKGLSEGVQVMRLAGANRYATSAEIMKWELGLNAEAPFQPDVEMHIDGMGVATGTGFADALGATSLLGKIASPLLLVADNNKNNLAATQANIEELVRTSTPQMKSGYIFGGTGAVSVRIEELLNDAVRVVVPQVVRTNYEKLYFLCAETVYQPGETLHGETITHVWSGADVTATAPDDVPLWKYESFYQLIIEESFSDARPTCLCRWFSGCADVVGLKYLNTSEVTDMSFAFSGYSSATLDLSHFDTSKVTNMVQMFSGSDLESLDLSGFDVSKMKYASRMFDECVSLKTIYCADSGTEWVFDPECETDDMFYACKELKGVYGETVVAYAEGNVGAEYARSAKLGGYFTPKNEE